MLLAFVPKPVTPGIVDDSVSVMRKLVVGGKWNTDIIVTVAVAIRSVIVFITIVIMALEIQCLWPLVVSK